MALLRIKNFGGLVPKASPRELPDNAAQVNHNLLSSTPEFRPVGIDVTVLANSGLTNPKTIFRLQRNADGTLNINFANQANWKVYAGYVSHAKYALNSDTTDRHVVTFDDGSAAPRWIDATGENRLLGVPKPAAPTATLNVVDEFTPEERATDLTAALATIIQAVNDSASTVWRGATSPGTTTAGYLDRTPANGFDPGYAGHQLRAFRLATAGGAVSNSYGSVAATEYSWIFDPLLGGFPASMVAGTSWGGSAGTPHWVIPFDAYGITKDIDQVTLSATLTAMPMPGTTDGTKLFTALQVSEIVAKVVDMASPTGAVKPRLDALSSKVSEIKALLDGSGRTSLSATVQAFYSKTDVAAEITAAIDNFANNVFQYADLVARSSLPGDYVGAGAV